MVKEKNKYLDDEQVKRNIELFNSDREKFMKESNELDFGKKSKEFEFRDDLINKKDCNKKEPDNKEKVNVVDIRKKISKIDIILIVLFLFFCFFSPIFVPETGSCTMGLFSGPGCDSNGYIVSFFICITPFVLIAGGDLSKNSFFKIFGAILLFVFSLYVELANPGFEFVMDKMCLVLIVLSVYFFVGEIFVIFRNSKK